MDKVYQKELCPLEKKFGYVDNTVHPLNNWILMFCRDFCLPESLALGVFTVNNVQIAKTIVLQVPSVLFSICETFISRTHSWILFRKPP